MCLEKTKICVTCNLELPLHHFSFRSDTNKYRGQCKKCHKGYLSNRIDIKQNIDSLLLKGLKKCGRCGKIKNVDEFNLDKYTNTKLTSLCKSCAKIKGDIYRYKEESKRVLFKSRYSVSDIDLDDYFSKNTCDICGKELINNDKKLDHCHNSNKYRGVLCHNCNIGLGNFKDNTDILFNAIKYLNK